MAFSGNIGEWSEAYTLFKVLSDKKLYVGDENLEKIAHLFYPVIKVLRSELGVNYEYTIESDLVVITGDGELLCKVKLDKFTYFAQRTFELIQQRKNLAKKGAFELSEIEQFLRDVHCHNLKAPSSQKTDITLVIHDSKTNQTPSLGFSIKSQLGGASTLLNAGKTTNFRYQLFGMNDHYMDEINGIESKQKIKDRIEKLRLLGVSLDFQRIENEVFANNLILIDSRMDEILSELLVLFYTSSSGSSVSGLVAQLEKSNPLGFNCSHSHQFYQYKIKRLLTDIAVGLTPSKIWDGLYDATGGYLVVKDSGELVCYHLYNKNQFEDYLFANTKFETASTRRHQFGSIYKMEDRYFINLNLQIRFIK